jgi:ATP-dependent Clp protease ATP-binding subunit ClpC
MYDRFTDRARKVMQLANQEAQRLNHEYVADGVAVPLPEQL